MRPELVVDATAALQPALVRDPLLRFLGLPGPLGRGRLVAALAPNRYKGPVQLVAPLLLKDHLGRLINDPSNTVIGERNALWVTRMVSATKTLDTRRL